MQVSILAAFSEQLRTSLITVLSGQPAPPGVMALLQPPPDLPETAAEVISKLRIGEDKVRMGAAWGQKRTREKEAGDCTFGKRL